MHCPCCSDSSPAAALLASEVNFGLPFRQLCARNKRAYHAPKLSLEEAKQWGLSEEYGVYLLWKEEGPCSLHGGIRMRAVYVGKGYARWRIVKHWKQKAASLSSLMPIHSSFVPLKNRHAKYVEQLLLDQHTFELNKFENIGTQRLYACAP